MIGRYKLRSGKKNQKSVDVRKSLYLIENDRAELERASAKERDLARQLVDACKRTEEQERALKEEQEIYRDLVIKWAKMKQSYYSDREVMEKERCELEIAWKMPWKSMKYLAPVSLGLESLRVAI